MSSTTRNQHAVVAGAAATPFGVNTITGVRNWWRGATMRMAVSRRTDYTVLMFYAEDAGFVATGVLR
ncbi:MAG: hypothetical protein IPP20_10415 [Gemmatimonadetes bacterium]|nr:hypothetical protein [Gemmatimonadota bacterium]